MATNPREAEDVELGLRTPAVAMPPELLAEVMALNARCPALLTILKRLNLRCRELENAEDCGTADLELGLSFHRRKFARWRFDADYRG